MVIATGQLQIKALAKVQTRFAIATLVLTEGAVPSRSPTLRACDAVATRRRSSNEHREKARTDAILWCSFARLGLCGVQERNG